MVQLYGSQLGAVLALGRMGQWLETLLGGCYGDLVLVGRDQGFCHTFYNTQDSPMGKSYLTQNVSSAPVEQTQCVSQNSTSVVGTVLVSVTQ